MNLCGTQLNDSAHLGLAAIWRASWQGGLALLLFWIVTRVFSRIPAAVKVWLWRLVYLKFLVAFFWATPIDLTLLPAPARLATSAAATHESPLGLADSYSAPSELRSSPKKEADNIGSPVLRSAPAAQVRVGLLILWSLGVLACGARFCQQGRRARRLRRNSRPVTHPWVERERQALAAVFRLKTAPVVLETEQSCRPALMGILRPAIVLPIATASCLPPEQLRLILAHEMAHVKRHDLLWMRLFSLCEALFFFHPLLWLAKREWLMAQEMACDELVLRLTRVAPRDYGSMLLRVAAQNRIVVPQPGFLSVGIIETKRTLQRRLLAMKHLTSNPARKMTVAAIALLLIAPFWIVPWQVVAQNADTQAEVAKLKEENARLRAELEQARAESEAARQQAHGW